MIKQHFVRAFERGAAHDHTTNIGLKWGSSQVFHVMEDSKKTTLQEENAAFAIEVNAKTRQNSRDGTPRRSHR